MLAYFDPTQQTEVHVDSSKFGIGCVLVQNEHPIAYGSCALTPTQQKYSPMEKEMLAVLVGCNKFHQYLYGAKNVLIITDHKPLEAIFKKDLAHTPTRLAKMVLQLRKYDLVVKWKPGKSMFLLDTLSRAYLASMDEDIDSHIEVENGWPKRYADCNGTLKKFWCFKSELCQFDRILYKDTKLIIPKSMKKELVKMLHEGHHGIKKSRAQARQIMYWPGLNTDIEQFFKQCSVCQMYQKRNPRQLLLPHS